MWIVDRCITVLQQHGQQLREMGNEKGFDTTIKGLMRHLAQPKECRHAAMASERPIGYIEDHVDAASITDWGGTLGWDSVGSGRQEDFAGEKSSVGYQSLGQRLGY